MSRRFSLTLAWAAAAFAAAAVGRHPYLQDVRSDRATVLWATTGEGGAGEVRFSADGVIWRSAPSAVQYVAPEQTGSLGFYQHRAELRALSSGTEYRYRVYLDGRDALPEIPAEGLRFRTAAPGRFTFLALGDSGDGGAGQLALARRMNTENPELVLHTGDVAYEDGTFAQYESYFFAVYRELLARMPFYLAPGNHDYYFREAAAFRALFAPPTDGAPAEGRGLVYSFDWGNVHFVFADTNTPLADADAGRDWMLRWLDRDLGATRQAFRVLVFHHPPYPTSKHVDDPDCARARRWLLPLVEKHAVHLVLNGHEHSYQRFRPWRDSGFSASGPGTILVTTGGGGSSVYPPPEDPRLAVGRAASHYLRVGVDAARMLVQAIGVSGEVLDQFEISAAPELTADGVRDAAEYGPALAPGGLVAAFGWNLATGDAAAGSLPLPGVLGGTVARWNGTPLPLLFVSRHQVNLQLPFVAPAEGVLRLESPYGVTESRLRLRDAAPAIFHLVTETGRWPAITRAGGALVTAADPARAGEWVTVYLTGLGLVSTAVAAGTPSPVAEATVRVRAVVAGVDCPVQYAGLTPGFAGLYQVNLRLPAGTTGALTLRLEAGGAASAPLTIHVR